MFKRIWYEFQSLRGYGRNSNVKKEKVGLLKFKKIS